MDRTHAFREGGGLAKSRAARGVQLAAQPLDLAAQPIARSFALFQVVPESFDLLSQLFRGGLTRGGLRRAVGALTHAPVMPESARQYKSDPVINYPGFKDRGTPHNRRLRIIATESYDP
jgi:hypothetical protein